VVGRIRLVNNPFTSSGIDPAAFRLVARRLNQQRYHVACLDGMRHVESRGTTKHAQRVRVGERALLLGLPAVGPVPLQTLTTTHNTSCFAVQPLSYPCHPSYSLDAFLVL
jgi:hypothetical protein